MPGSHFLDGLDGRLGDLPVHEQPPEVALPDQIKQELRGIGGTVVHPEVKRESVLAVEVSQRRPSARKAVGGKLPVAGAAFPARVEVELLDPHLCLEREHVEQPLQGDDFAVYGGRAALPEPELVPLVERRCVPLDGIAGLYEPAQVEEADLDRSMERLDDERP